MSSLCTERDLHLTHNLQIICVQDSSFCRKTIPEVFPTPANMLEVHQEAIRFLSENCSIEVSKWWPQLESDVFGACAREKGYDSVQFRPTTGAVGSVVRELF